MSPSKSVRLLYFAALAEALGMTAEEVPLPPGTDRVEDLLAWLRERGGPFASLTPERVQVTVNRQFAQASTPIAPGDEIALIPKRGT